MPSENTLSADEQLTLVYGPDHWRLLGPDGNPVLEVRAHSIFYHPAFGRWRDLPPGDRIDTAAIESVQVRWDGGWVVGFVMIPGLFRRLVRWTDSRKLAQADDAARLLSELTGLPLATEEDDQPAVTRVSRAPAVNGVIPPASKEPPQFAPAKPPVDAMPPQPEVYAEQPDVACTAGTPALTVAQVYTIKDASDVRLPLRMGGGAQLRKDDDERLLLTTATPSRLGSCAITVIGLLALAVFITVILAVRLDFWGDSPFVGLAIAGGGLALVGLLGVLILVRISRKLEKQIVFDRYDEMITIQPGENNKRSDKLPLKRVHGIRIRGEAVRKRAKLAYQRSVCLMLDDGDRVIFEESRDSALPPDPAVTPSLAALRRQADEKAGPSLARAAARVIAWYLQVPLADE